MNLPEAKTTVKLFHCLDAEGMVRHKFSSDMNRYWLKFNV